MNFLAVLKVCPMYTLSSLLFNTVQKVLAKATRQEKEVKDIYMGKKKNKAKFIHRLDMKH